MISPDAKSRMRELYLPPAKGFVLVDVPETRYVMIDGRGATDRTALDHAVKWLFAVIYPIKRIARQRMGRNFVEPPVEGLWWADDVADFVCGNREKLNWRMMMVYEDLVGLGRRTADLFTADRFDDAVAKATNRLGEPPAGLRVERYQEGLSAQIMHIGPPVALTGIVARLHQEFLPAHRMVPNGRHHEIYLTDPSRTAPAKMKTVLRQPVRPVGRTESIERSDAAPR